MDFLHENASIRSLVAKAPEYASIFEKLGLDYCCKGNKTIKEACDEKKLNIIEVLRTLKNLQASNTSVNWDQMPIKEIVEHILSTYHVYAKQELQRISQLLKKLNAKHGQKYPYIPELQNVFANMKDSLLNHMNEEEQIVFPLILNLTINKRPCQEVINKYQDSLSDNHLKTGAAFEKINKINTLLYSTCRCMHNSYCYIK